MRAGSPLEIFSACFTNNFGKRKLKESIGFQISGYRYAKQIMVRPQRNTKSCINTFHPWRGRESQPSNAKPYSKEYMWSLQKEIPLLLPGLACQQNTHLCEELLYDILPILTYLASIFDLGKGG